ncbi:LPS export ABC transporter periplasmic protein LptC [Shewanella maritima]|uniref:LPS export ABC transporter periplasmic protein LptC n=1 Tax=Shewanella maritima TaxID=2520507 RepID=UPI0037351236
MNRVTLAIIIFFSTAIALYWQVQVKRNAMQDSKVKTVERPDFIANDLKTTMFNEQGYIESKVTATHMEHFESTNLTHFTDPVYLIFPENGEAQWRLSATKGQLDKENSEVTLFDDVLIDAIDIDEPLQSLRTKDMTLNLTTMIGTSQERVNIKGKGFIIDGLGLHADLNTQELTLLSQVEGIYEPH